MKKNIISIAAILVMGIALCSCSKNSGTKVSDVTVIDDNYDFLYCAENRDGTVSIGLTFGKTAIVNKKGVTTGYKYNSGSIKVASEIKGLPVRDVELTVISGLIESEAVTVPANVKVFALPYDTSGTTKNIEFLGSDTKFYTNEGTSLTAAIGKAIEGREITEKEAKKIFKDVYGY